MPKTRPTFTLSPFPFRLYLLELGRAHDHLLLPEAALKLGAVVAPPLAFERVRHHLEDDDAVAALLAALAPDALRGRAPERGHAAEARGQLVTHAVELLRAEASG